MRHRSPARRVVLTRQPAQAGAVEAGLAAAGCPVSFLPLTDFELPEDLAPLRAVVRLLDPGTDDDGGDIAWLVLTSPNSVRALVRTGWDGRLAQGVRVAVTGPGTARVLAESGCTEPPWMPDGDASAVGILAQFPGPGDAADAGRHLVLPQSALATDEVAEGLARRGWAVERVEAYRTVPYPAGPERRLLAAIDTEVDTEAATQGGTQTAISSGVGLGARSPGGELVAPDGGLLTPEDLAGADVVLTSPSAVRELVRRRGTTVPAETRFIAIGRPTARAARAAGLGLAGTAATPDSEGILAVLSPDRPD